jgi:hypothetical protein
MSNERFRNKRDAIEEWLEATEEVELKGKMGKKNLVRKGDRGHGRF